VLLQPSAAVLDSLGGRPAAVYGYVRAEFGRRYGLAWRAPLGFNNAYCLLMRQQQAEHLGLATITDLGRYLTR
jgi:osmoprotectant transport system permease protein